MTFQKDHAREQGRRNQANAGRCCRQDTDECEHDEDERWTDDWNLVQDGRQRTNGGSVRKSDQD